MARRKRSTGGTVYCTVCHAATAPVAAHMDAWGCMQYGPFPTPHTDKNTGEQCSGVWKRAEIY